LATESKCSSKSIIIDSSSSKIIFYNQSGIHTSFEAIGDYHSVFNINSGYIFNINASNINLKGTVKAEEYISSKGSVGKTYKEEFEDKQGNIRTRVYENGLIVSYKINGVEQ
jgi:hypothetical protein